MTCFISSANPHLFSNFHFSMVTPYHVTAFSIHSLSSSHFFAHMPFFSSYSFQNLYLAIFLKLIFSLNSLFCSSFVSSVIIFQYFFLPFFPSSFPFFVRPLNVRTREREKERERVRKSEKGEKAKKKRKREKRRKGEKRRK